MNSIIERLKEMRENYFVTSDGYAKDIHDLTVCLEKAVEALNEAETYATQTTLNEQNWDYLCGKVFREALTEISNLLCAKEGE